MLCPAVNSHSDQLLRLDPTDLSEGSDRRLFGLGNHVLAQHMEALGEPGWRGKQLAEAIYRQRLADLNAITTLPKRLRERLAGEGWKIGRPQIAQTFISNDGTERYLVECPAPGQIGIGSLQAA